MANYLNLQTIFAVFGVFATILFILKLLIFMFTGGDMEVHSDFESMSDTDTSFSFLSVQSILAFFMGFGWAGLAALTQLKLGNVLSVVLSIAVGAVFMFFSAYLMFMVKKLDKNIKVDLNECIGREGKAYTEIQPKSEGRIEIIINSKLEIVNAINLTDDVIPAFAQIKVEKIENNKLYIVKI